MIFFLLVTQDEDSGEDCDRLKRDQTIAYTYTEEVKKKKCVAESFCNIFVSRQKKGEKKQLMIVIK